MNTNLEFKNHINTHFIINNHGPVVLNEVHGYVNNIDEIVQYFVKLVSLQVENAYKYDDSTTFPYNGQINIKNCFFNYYKLKLTFKKGDDNFLKGGAKTDSIFQDENGNWICVPNINLTIIANNITSAIKRFSFAMGHELTHCYDLLQYAIKNNQDPWYSINNNRYFDITQNSNFGTGNIQALATILYNLNRMERNAYIAQLKQELQYKKASIRDNKTAFEAIKTTESYKKFLYLEQQVNIIFTITNKSVQNGLIETLNNIMKKNFTTWKQFKNYFLRRWLKWKKSYIMKASKIVYDIYANDNMWLDWGMMDNNTELKPE